MTAPDDSSRSPEQIIQEQVDAYNAHDLERFVGCYHDDVTMTRLPGGDVPIRDVDALRKAFGSLFSANPAVHVAILQRMVLDSIVIDHEHLTGRADGVEVQALVAYHVAGGKIRQYWVLRG